MLNIPVEIIEKIEQLNPEDITYAAFDLDNTLLVGDIGEAVFAALIEKGYIRDFGWIDYIELLKLDRKASYNKVIEVMNGLELRQLMEITYDLIRSEDAFIEIEGECIPVPKPNSIMKSLLTFLRGKGIAIFIVTASNEISAGIICQEYFGIPASNVKGASVPLNENNRISYEPSVIPFAAGKVEALKERFSTQPVITGGDGIWDKFLLDYTLQNGIRLWLGTDAEEFLKLKNEYGDHLFFCQVPEK